MRILLLTRGLPGSGKSTWIRENGLEPYTISTDRLRLLFAAPIITPEGKMDISQKVNTIVFKCLDEMLETRFRRGDFTVIDACHVKTSDLTRYRDAAKELRYRVIMVDFSDVPKEECIRRNMQREDMFRLEERHIERMYASLEKCEVPSWIQVFSHNDQIIL